MARLAQSAHALQEVIPSEIDTRFPDFRQNQNGRLLAFARNADGRFQAIVGEDAKYQSHRSGLGDLSWNAGRQARIVPLEV